MKTIILSVIALFLFSSSITTSEKSVSQIVIISQSAVGLKIDIEKYYKQGYRVTHTMEQIVSTGGAGTYFKGDMIVIMEK